MCGKTVGIIEGSMGYAYAYMCIFFFQTLPHNAYESCKKREMFYVGFYVTFFYVKLDFELYENEKVKEKMQK